LADSLRSISQIKIITRCGFQFFAFAAPLTTAVDSSLAPFAPSPATQSAKRGELKAVDNMVFSAARRRPFSGCRFRASSVFRWLFFLFFFPSLLRFGLLCPVFRVMLVLCLGVFFMAALVGFCGSRRLGSSWASVVSRCVSAVGRSGRAVAVGCAAGADAFALSAARRAGLPVSFFSVASGSFGSGRSAFARRSSAFVSAVAASGSGCGLVAFVSASCPAALFPSPVAARCFAGFGSGSWASVALAVGLGVPVVVFPVGGASALPSGWSGSWVACSSGVWSGGFSFVPEVVSCPAPLFAA
jgi:hypothetical protein